MVAASQYPSRVAHVHGQRTLNKSIMLQIKTLLEPTISDNLDLLGELFGLRQRHLLESKRFFTRVDNRRVFRLGDTYMVWHFVKHLSKLPFFGNSASLVHAHEQQVTARVNGGAVRLAERQATGRRQLGGRRLLSTHLRVRPSIFAIARLSLLKVSSNGPHDRVENAFFQKDTSALFVLGKNENFLHGLGLLFV